MIDPENDDFITLSAFVEEMAAVDYHFKERFYNKDISLIADKVLTGTACQLKIEVDENNQVHIGAIPPMYYVETTFMPVFHNITLNIEIQK